MELSNKTILLTGASSGIGYELTKQLAAEKCNLILLARRKEILDSLAQKIKSYDNTILTYKCDIRNKQEVQNAFQDIAAKNQKIDIAILNSGVNNRMRTKNFNSNLAEDTFQVNVLGMVYCIEELLKDYIPRRNGVIVGVSSIADIRGFPNSGLYCASKAAVSALLESLRPELKRQKIKIIIVKPGFVKTPMIALNMFKMPFLIDVDKAAEIIIRGIKKEKKIIQFPIGTVIGSKIVKLLPNSVFDFVFSKQLLKED